jgi:AmmeMemoRadiSam system protein A
MAREAIAAAAAGQSLPELDLDSLPPPLRRPAACFVTINKAGVLRGCTGALVAEKPLALEVVRVAAQTATSDPRFGPVASDEVEALEVELSILTQPRPLSFSDPADLAKQIRPGVDGVTLYQGWRRATFLPQVWQRIPEPEDFLGMLCRKMGLTSTAWRLAGLSAEVYQAISFSEAELSQE